MNIKEIVLNNGVIIQNVVTSGETGDYFKGVGAIFNKKRFLESIGKDNKRTDLCFTFRERINDCQQGVIWIPATEIRYVEFK